MNPTAHFIILGLQKCWLPIRLTYFFPKSKPSDQNHVQTLTRVKEKEQDLHLALYILRKSKRNYMIFII